MDENDISRIIVDCAYHIHRELGPGLLESVYEKVLMYELEKKGLNIDNQVAIPVRYHEISLELGFRADLIIENKIIIELKSVEEILPVHKKQLLTYLKLTGLKLGLLINFNSNLIKDGITRIVNNL
ncbi:MAG: GxxExxY protein [Candidatus Marinimicrobia bacterium]|jgi:GxxExxY protein|nr:GxxExxY protein [Candidatus Neomarinimicrobiota bacterium]HOO14863.1 GxxExxY protein [Candidatus Neomarinimicrobiota bacterium]HOU18106.1 GxxExxY protein [Candidatus Neomarinimicrobiota bacterium]HOU18107.1 GxxExxY protein [Candidatus Neomarinimicrobiota bacterium]HOV24556.1 GxxExxY protein [Candidatus Neomarinimicrobiota bacterium]